MLLSAAIQNAQLSEAVPAPPDDRLGICPHCHAAGEAEQFVAPRLAVRNVGAGHYVTCTQHGCYWFLGFNLVGWAHESEDVWKANAQILRQLTQVAPRYLPETEAAMRFARLLGATLQ